MDSQVSIETIKKLRREIGAPILEIKKALVKSGGNLVKARDLLKIWSKEKAAEKKREKTSVGIVEAYIHTNGRVGSLVTLSCQTDFVAHTKEFKDLAHEIALQVASMNPKNENELLNQEYIRDPKKKIKDFINEYIAKFGENIVVKKIARFSI